MARRRLSLNLKRPDKEKVLIQNFPLHPQIKRKRHIEDKENKDILILRNLNIEIPPSLNFERI
jgi:hypothetical protein